MTRLIAATVGQDAGRAGGGDIFHLAGLLKLAADAGDDNGLQAGICRWGPWR